MVNRLAKLSKSHSFFLFGARGTGKSTLIKERYLEKDYLFYDLLDPDLEDEFSRSPMRLYERIKAQKKKPEWIIIDEVQKIPRLLDVVHMCIEDLKVRFILTGSSARKLKRGGANLLAGRAFLYSLFPLTELELSLAQRFDLQRYLRWGSLPKLLELSNDDDKKQYLKTYAQLYLKEEIKAEQLVRNIDPFREFLEISAQMNGKIINYSGIAKDVGVDHKTVQNYYEILADTWIGNFLPAFHQSVRKSQKLSPKFYLFDIGVKNALARQLESIPVMGTSLFGDLFEHFIINEIFRYNEYKSKDFRLSYLATKSGSEVDLILSRGREHYAIEIKSKERVDRGEVQMVRKLASDIRNLKKIYYVSQQEETLELDGVLCVHWKEFFRIFNEEF